MQAQTNTLTAPALYVKTCCPKSRIPGRSVAERLEWTALVVLPLSSVVAAVSLLSHAVR